MTGVFGGAFDPPHNGHVALARAALDRFELDRLVVLVVERPGHRTVELDPAARLRLAELAFADVPRTVVGTEPAAFTVDAVRDGRFGDAIFLVGADEFATFLSWKEPDEILEHVRLGVATRPGHAEERLRGVLAALRRPERVELFTIPAVPVSGTDVRARARRGESLDGLVPPAVAAEIAEHGLYR